jgi:uncharacterized protein YecE (DUF72 family)
MVGAPMIRVGTSGYNYPEWKGSFYPSDMPASKMFRFYAERFPTVEINYTFYRMPNEKIVTGWAAQAPDGFTYTLKAPRRITHIGKLRGTADSVRFFCEVAAKLGSKLGVLLFQLAPTFKKDLAIFDEFLATLPAGTRAAFEFRHPTWDADDVYERLRARNLSLCIADSEKRETPVVITADYAYFRLRDEGYGEPDIARWADTIAERGRGVTDVFVYFKHEEEGKGPQFAKMLMEKLPQAAVAQAAGG